MSRSDSRLASEPNRPSQKSRASRFDSTIAREDIHNRSYIVALLLLLLPSILASALRIIEKNIIILAR